MPTVGPLSHRTRRFFPSGGRNHRQHSLHLLTEGWARWLGLSVLDEYGDGIDPPKVVTNTGTDRARRGLTLLIRPTVSLAYPEGRLGVQTPHCIYKKFLSCVFASPALMLIQNCIQENVRNANFTFCFVSQTPLEDFRPPDLLARPPPRTAMNCDYWRYPKRDVEKRDRQRPTNVHSDALTLAADHRRQRKVFQLVRVCGRQSRSEPQIRSLAARRL